MQMRFKYVVEDVDRYGNVRLYVRVPGRRKVRLRANFGTDEFLAAYTAAVAGHLQTPRQAIVAKRGSFRHLCIQYYASATFNALDRATQSWRRRALDSICQNHADKPVALMLPRHVRQLRDELKECPGAANQRLKALKALFAWACEDEPESAPQDPTLGVKKINMRQKAITPGTPMRSDNFAPSTQSEARRAWRSSYCFTRVGAARTRSASVRRTFAMAEFVLPRRRTSTGLRSRLTFLCIPISAPPFQRDVQNT
jgi:hypothetical protein